VDPGEDKMERQESLLVLWAYWLNVILVILAVPLGLLYLLLITQGGAIPLTAMFPLLLVAMTLAHMSVLHRARDNQAVPLPTAGHGLIAIAGTATLLVMFFVLASDPEGGAFFPFFVVGAVISCGVWACFFDRFRKTE